MDAHAVAEWLDVTVAWVYAETRADRIPHIPVGRYCRYRPSSIEAWLREQEHPMTTKRAYGTGSLMQKHGAWYGRWRPPDGRRLSRRIGPIRKPGTDSGLTRREAEAQLRKIMLAEEVRPTPKAAARRTVDDAASALIEHKRVQGVSRSYLQTLSAAQRHHFGPEIGGMVLRKVHRRDVEAMSARLLSRGLAPKTVANTLKILHGVFERRDRPGVNQRQPGPPSRETAPRP